MDHAITKNQKMISGAFGMNADSLRRSANEQKEKALLVAVEKSNKYCEEIMGFLDGRN